MNHSGFPNSCQRRDLPIVAGTASNTTVKIPAVGGLPAVARGIVEAMFPRMAFTPAAPEKENDQ